MTNQYSELQEFLNKCIEMWWKPRGKLPSLPISIPWDEDTDLWFQYYHEHAMRSATYSYHDLFSVDSGLLDFIRWKFGNTYSHYSDMWPMTKEQKIKYFLENALLPTQDEEIKLLP